MSKILINSKEKKNGPIYNGYIKVQNHPKCLSFQIAYGCLQYLYTTKVQIVLSQRKQPELRLDTP